MRRAVWLVALLVLWELLVRTDLVNQLLLPAPSGIVLAAVVDGERFVDAFAVTLAEIAMAAAIAAALGISLGVLGAASSLLAVVVSGVLASLFAVPLVILYPLFMAWVGIGPTSKVVFGVLSGFVPIALNTLNGIRAVETRYLLMARGIGANKLQLYLRIMLPFAIPSIISGLRIGIGLTIIGVVVAEMLASTAGIGFLISYYRTLFETGHIYLGILLAILLAIGLNRGLSAVERRFMGWQARQESAAA
jgi:NitT/TauT family transport system permease protein/taurine transport system permease protein